MNRRALLIACLIAGCGDKRAEHKPPPHDARQTQRVIEPSNERVGPLPPYLIRADGIGPYRLNEKLSDLLEQLASGPRIALFEITGVVHRNVIRAEDDLILVGGEQASTASFVAVVGGAEIARTESGIHVGSTRDELVAALGPPVDDAEHARDPRLVVPRGLASARVVIHDDKVAAIVVTTASGAASQALPGRADCDRPAIGHGMGACLTAAGEVLEVEGDEIQVKSASGERTIATLPKFAGLVFAAPLRGADGRDEIVVITRTDDGQLRSWWLTALRFEGTRIVRSVETTPLYQLSTANARWIGADLHDIELYLELTGRADGIDVGGLLTTPGASKAAKIRDVVVISPVQVARHKGKASGPEASDAGVSGSPALPSSGGARIPPDAATGADAGTESDSNKP